MAAGPGRNGCRMVAELWSNALDTVPVPYRYCLSRLLSHEHSLTILRAYAEHSLSILVQPDSSSHSIPIEDCWFFLLKLHYSAFTARCCWLSGRCGREAIGL